MNELHVVVPAGIYDPRQPSGGNVYDRRVCTALTGRGWNVCEHAVNGPWPDATDRSLQELCRSLSAVPDNAAVIVDGLIASASAEVLLPAAQRLHLIVLVHLPLHVRGESAVLTAAATVVTTSTWTRDQLLASYRLAPHKVQVAPPGADRGHLARGTPSGLNLLCVAPVCRHKGHDLLLTALACVRDLQWRCRFVGSLEREPEFVECIRDMAARAGLADRIELCGPRARVDLDHTYIDADLLVHASRGETYGMVISEALAHALPVVATDVGGVAEALGTSPEGRPGMLVARDDPVALAAALRRWLTDDKARRRLRCAAVLRRQTLPSWDSTADRIGQVLAEATR